MKKAIFYLLIFSLTILTACNGKMDSNKDASKLSKGTDWEYQMAYQRGIEAVNWALPAVSMFSMRNGNFSLGGGYNTVYWASEPPTAKQEAITANNQTPYATVFLDTKKGPVVLDVPPATSRTAIFGSAINVWQEPVADIGAAGLDQGKGGKYLFLPPDYKGKDIEGYFNVRMKTYLIFVALRCIPLNDADFTEAALYSKNINAYNLTDADNPPEGEYIDMAGKYLPTLPKFDISYFELIHELIEFEPMQERDMVMGGMLASIGITKGVPFAPGAKIKKALENAIKSGYDYLEYMFETPGFSTEKYWTERQWMSLKEPSKEGFVFDEGEYLLLDERGSLYHWVTFIPKHLGKASAYLLDMYDSNGELLMGNKNYMLKIPANVPARDFWSAIVYSKKNKAFIYNDQNKVGISSYDKSSLKMNDDGSVNIYFGEKAPEGLTSNWIPTAGEDFFLLFRFYGPEETYFDKSFKLPDVQLIK